MACRTIKTSEVITSRIHFGNNFIRLNSNLKLAFYVHKVFIFEHVAMYRTIIGYSRLTKRIILYKCFSEYFFTFWKGCRFLYCFQTSFSCYLSSTSCQRKPEMLAAVDILLFHNSETANLNYALFITFVDVLRKMTVLCRPQFNTQLSYLTYGINRTS